MVCIFMVYPLTMGNLRRSSRVLGDLLSYVPDNCEYLAPICFQTTIDKLCNQI